MIPDDFDKPIDTIIDAFEQIIEGISGRMDRLEKRIAELEKWRMAAIQIFDDTKGLNRPLVGMKGETDA
jgi:Mg2+ and Co2+ transporter CorA